MYKALSASFIVGHLLTSTAHAEFSHEGSFRLRYETIDSPISAGRSGNDHLISSRFLLHSRWQQQTWFAGAELQDARAWLSQDQTPLGTDDVNALEPLQWYAGLQGDTWQATLGRQTIDLGSRRLIARNGYRNTINAFDGVVVNKQINDWNSTWLAVKPVRREPFDRDGLEQNRQELDQTEHKRRFSGVFFRRQKAQQNLEAYVFHFNDEIGRKERRTTVGGRLHLPQLAGSDWSYGLELMQQFGKSNSGGVEQDISARYINTYLAYDFDDAWQSNLQLTIDYGSGEDADPSQISSFRTAYGARRGDFGATGLYGAIGYRNIQSPELRWRIKPSDKISAFVGYRGFWVDSRDDSVSRTGLHDQTTGGSRFVGSQLESRLRYQWFKNLRIETSIIWFDKADYFNRAGVNRSNTLYGYSQFDWFF